MDLSTWLFSERLYKRNAANASPISMRVAATKTPTLNPPDGGFLYDAGMKGFLGARRFEHSPGCSVKPAHTARVTNSASSAPLYLHPLIRNALGDQAVFSLSCFSFVYWVRRTQSATLSASR